MFTIKEHVPANQIWSTAKSHTDKGFIAGYVRGYNIEVKLTDGSTEWLSSEWIENDPEIEFNDDFHQFYFKEHQWIPTGRICFRGYAIQRYDYEERDYYVELVDDEKVLALGR